MDDAPSGRVAGAAAGLVEQLLGQLGDRVVLLQLELRRATGAMAAALGLAFVGAILLATAWIAICGAVAWLAVQQGVGAPIAVIAVVLLNLVLSVAAFRLALRQLGAVGVPLTLHHLARHAGRDDAIAAQNQAGWAP